MITTLALSACVTFLGLSALAALVLLFDRLTPERLVRERHDLALAAFAMTPLLFALGLMPGDAGPAPVPAASLFAAASPSTTAEPVPRVAARSAPRPEGAPGRAAARQAERFAEAAPPPASRLGPLSRLNGLLAALLPAAFLLWLLGAVAALIRLVLDIRALMAFKTRAANASLPSGLSLSRHVELRRSPEVRAPLLAGYRRPAIIVPNDFPLCAVSLPILEHEVAHLVRRDPWTVLWMRGLSAVFWWAVPLFFLERIVSRTRESLCDLRAARVTGQPVRLAHALLDAAARGTVPPALALAAAPGRSALAARVRRLSSGDCLKRRRALFVLPLVLPALGLLALVLTPKLGVAKEATPVAETVSLASDDGANQKARRGRSVSTRPEEGFGSVRRIEVTDLFATVQIELGGTEPATASASGPNAGSVRIEDEGDVLTVAGPSQLDRNRFQRDYRRAGRDLKDRSYAEDGIDDAPLEALLEERPVVTVRAPRDTALRFADSALLVRTDGDAGPLQVEDNLMIVARLGDVTQAEIELSSSDDVVLGDVHGAIAATLTGSGDLRFGSAESAELVVSGSGDIEFDEAERAKLIVSGSGDIEGKTVRNELEASVPGSGDVSVQRLGTDVPAEAAKVAVPGDGDLRVGGGRVERLDAAVTGSGNLTFAATSAIGRLASTGTGTLDVAKVDHVKSVGTVTIRSAEPVRVTGRPSGADHDHRDAHVHRVGGEEDCAGRPLARALLAAAEAGSRDAVRTLISEGADPNCVLHGEGSPLIAAVRARNPKIVAMLIEAGADPDLSVPGDGTPLITAARSGDFPSLELLLEAGADVDGGVSGDGNPLIAAVHEGEERVVERLIGAGADPDGYVPGDETPLVAAAQSDYLDLAQRLVRAGADVTLSVAAPSASDVGSYEDYVAGRARAYRASDGTPMRSPLGEALRHDHDELAAWLRSQGATK